MRLVLLSGSPFCHITAVELIADTPDEQKALRHLGDMLRLEQLQRSNVALKFEMPDDGQVKNVLSFEVVTI